MGGAHLVDNLVGGILDWHSLCQPALTHQLIHLQEQLRHDAIGAADACLGTDYPAADKLLIRAVEHDVVLTGCCLEHLNILHRHGGIFHTDNLRIFPHFSKEAAGQRHACQLRNVVDNKVSLRCSGANIVPILGNGMLRQAEVDWRYGGNGIHPQAFCVAGQLHAVLGIVAGHMGNHGQLALCHLHDIFQHNLLVLNALVDALPGGAVYIHALDALINEILCQLLHPLRADFTSLIVAGIKCRNNALVLIQISHDCFSPFL